MLISINITFITLIYSYSETYKCSVTYEQKNIHFFIIDVKLKTNICCFLTRFFTKEVDILCVSHNQLSSARKFSQRNNDFLLKIILIA